jgi:hypothetical protein
MTLIFLLKVVVQNRNYANFVRRDMPKGLLFGKIWLLAVFLKN